ncbi:MAG: hypothetical protein K940chlam7_01546 [Chlamydiae bacterium]|nr:hypothetical protein [Chlamydiota bacterium]
MSGPTPAGGDNPNLTIERSSEGGTKKPLDPTAAKTAESARTSFSRSFSKQSGSGFDGSTIFCQTPPPPTPTNTPNGSREGTPIDPNLVLRSSLCEEILGDPDS